MHDQVLEQVQNAFSNDVNVKKDLKLAKRKIRKKLPPSKYSRPSGDELPASQQTKRKPVILTIPTNVPKDDKNHSFLKRAGKFLLGPEQLRSPVKCIKHYLARKDGTDEFYVLKILTLKNVGEKNTADDIQGKTLFHTEHSLLSLVKKEMGVIQEHGLFRETVMEVGRNDKGEETFAQVRRICLVLDCFVGHDFSPKYASITNLQCVVIKEKKLVESKAMPIFYKVVKIVERLHKLNIVHRDLKLGNIILNQDSGEVTLSNFCLGQHLCSGNDLLKDQRGSPAYISPDVISGKPYLGKPSDMWALGVVLFTLLFGQFPFYDADPPELFRKIKLGQFQIPRDSEISQEAVELIEALLNVDPSKRVTAADALPKVRSMVGAELSLMWNPDLQIVPKCHSDKERQRTLSWCELSALPLDFADITFILDKCEEYKKGLEPQKKKCKANGRSPKFRRLPHQETFRKLHGAIYEVTEEACVPICS